MRTHQLRASILPTLLAAFLAGTAIVAGGGAGCSAELQPPTATIAMVPAGIAVGALVALDGSPSKDPNGLPLAYSWRLSQVPAGSAAAMMASTTARPWFTADMAGDYVVELVVSDGVLAGLAKTTKLTAGPCGSAIPVVDKITSTPAAPGVGAPVQLSAGVTDADMDPSCAVGDDLVYHWSFASVPTGSKATLNGTSLKAPSFTPDVAGDYVARLVVTDREQHESAPVLLAITAASCGGNSPMVAAASAMPASPATGQLVTFSATVTDGDTMSPCTDTEHFTYHWALVQSPPGSAAGIPNAALISPSILADVPGAYVAEVYVTDSAGHPSPPQSVSVTVNTCGSNPPVLSNTQASPPTPSAGQIVQLQTTVTDADTVAPCTITDKPTLTWSFVSVPMGSTAVISGASEATPWFLADMHGSYVIEVSAVDAQGLKSAPMTLTVTTSSCGENAPVVATASALPAAPATGQLVTFSATATDADTVDPCTATEHFTYHWALVQSPAGSAATIINAALMSPSILADVPGAYAAEVYVTDSEGHPSPVKTVNVAVGTCGSNPPVVTIPQASSSAPHVGQVVQLQTTVTDADTVAPCTTLEHYTFDWALVSVPAGSTAMISGAAQATPWFLADVPGSYVVEVSAIDAQGLKSAPMKATVTASSCGAAAPVIASMASSPAAPGLNATISLSASVSDADTSNPCNLPQTLSYAWAITGQPAGSLATLNNPAATSPSFVADVAGVYTMALTAKDSTGLSSTTATTTVTVSATPACGTAPPVAILSSINSTNGNCNGLCNGAAQMSPAPPNAPNATPPNWVISANGHFDIQLNASGSYDPDAAPPCSLAEPLSYSWELIAAPFGAQPSWAFGGNNTTTTLVNPTLSLDNPGTYTVRLTVSDAAKSSKPMYIQINL